MAGGFYDFLRWALGWKSQPTTLAEEQKTLGGIPSVSLSVGGHDLGDYVVAYIYEEAAYRPGGLTVWLENRDDRFDDLATDYPGLVHGAAVDFRRGLVINGVASREKLPRTWVESIQWTEDGQMLLTCIDWLGKLERFYYSSTQTFSSQTHSTIASSILGQVGLTLAAGSFGYSTDFEVSRFESGRGAVQRLMTLCHEKLYVGTDGEMQFKRLDSSEGAGYTYDFSTGGTNHPLLNGTEIFSAAAPFNTVAVTGGADESFSGSAANAAQVALVGTRRVNLRVPDLASNAQCTEVAESYLDDALSHLDGGVILARPHFTLRLYDVISVAGAPPWGGPTSSAGRVRQIFERYNAMVGRWEQEIVLGDVPFQALSQRTRIGEVR